ncbi:hypothetical protein GCM10011385_06400 [Nitratireductor aestuarii]|uniref:Trimeric autotransporter adhesin n=1 Tax=Nitratireductor aestuarii TaxID=1735103 RepID=A0A916RF97_9HYPH|nr:YadA-like family protein [Nitratireductor aestuarii]GGA55559.1 hypothetical protein GCM10011385_06400 [Nitratireductor aestuarii]
MKSFLNGAAVCAIVALSATAAQAYQAGAGANDGGSNTNVAIGDGWTNIAPGNEWSTAIGYGAEVGPNSSQSTALGFDAKIGQGTGSARDSTAIGTRSNIGSGSFSSTAVGNTAIIGANSQESTAIGQAARIGDGASGSLAVGHRASVTDDTTNAAAIGRDSVASHNNSVALGFQSTTKRGAESNYNGFGLSATESSVGEVAIGTATGNRTITGVASGTQDNDAVNVKQLRAVSDSAVKYDTTGGAVDYTQITLGQGDVGDAPVLIRNVRAGTVAANSYDAVNGSQVHAISSSVASAFGGGSTVQLDGTISAPSYQIQGTSYDNVGSAFGAVDDRLSQLSAEFNGGLANLSSEINSQAGKAGAVGLAASSLRFDDRAGKLSIAAGGGVWNNYGAMAFGAGYTSMDQRIRTNLTGVTTGDKWGVAAGVSFTLN